MKKFLVGTAISLVMVTAAAAADLAPAPMYTKAPPMMAATAFSWTGFYLGGHIGYGWVDEHATFISSTSPVLLNPIGTTIGGNHDGFLGGVQAGYNYQVQSWVLGIGGDFSWTDAHSTTVLPATLFPTGSSTSHVRTNWYGTVTGRLGYAWDKWLIYGKGGVAWVNETAGANASVFGTTVSFNNINDTRTGWTLGGGLEWAVTEKVSLFAEYDYLGFDTKSYTFVSPAFSNTVNDSTNVSEVKAGVNYRF